MVSITSNLAGPINASELRCNEDRERILSTVYVTHQLHELDDTGYGPKVGHVQSDARERVRLTRFRLHRGHLSRIIAGVVAGTVHGHHGLRHHVTLYSRL